MLDNRCLLVRVPPASVHPGQNKLPATLIDTLESRVECGKLYLCLPRPLRHGFLQETSGLASCAVCVRYAASRARGLHAPVSRHVYKVHDADVLSCRMVYVPDFNPHEYMLPRMNSARSTAAGGLCLVPGNMWLPAQRYYGARAYHGGMHKAIATAMGLACIHWQLWLC